MKAVMISIQPKWCELIASGKKTVEVRKTKPKLEPPFRCYIYATKPKRYYKVGEHLAATDENLYLSGGKVKMSEGFEFWADGTRYEYLSGKVIGEFVCDHIDYWNHHIHDDDTITLERASELSRVSEDELLKYADLGHFYAWHISDLVIYEHPMELGMFAKPDKCPYNLNGECAYPRHCYRAGQTKRCGDYLERPPQSWCYVEEGGAE